MHGATPPYRPISTRYRTCPLSVRTQLMARGPGWRMADGESNSWHIKLIACDDPLLTWADMLATLRDIIDNHGVRAAIVDLRSSERLSGATAAAAAAVFAEFEQRGVKIAALVGPDLVHAIRLHRLLGIHARVRGTVALTEAEAVDWVSRSAPPVPPPIYLTPRPQLQPPRV